MTEESLIEADGPLHADAANHVHARIAELEGLLASANSNLACKDKIISDWKKFHPLTTYLKDFDERERRREATLFQLKERLDKMKDARSAGERRMRWLVRKTFPRQKPLPPFYERSMEDHFTGPVAIVAVLVTLLLITVCQVLYSIYSHRDVAIEYASYAMPFLGALVAGLIVFCDKHRGKLFFLSLFCLFLGLDAWIAIKPAPAIVISIANGIMALAILSWFFAIVVRSSKSRFAKAKSASENKERLWGCAIAYILGGLLSTFFMLTLLAACLGYYLRVYPCLRPYDPKLGSRNLSACPSDIKPRWSDAEFWQYLPPPTWLTIPS